MKQLPLALASIFIASAFSASANQPDNVFLFAHSSDDGKAGMSLAWCTDINNPVWYTIGDNYEFLKSDFGAWGSGKRMYTPRLTFTPNDNLWHCVFESTATGKTVSHAASADLKSWGPQTYLRKEDVSKFNVAGLDTVKITSALINGTEFKGSVSRVPYAMVKDLSQYVDHRRYQDLLNNQRCADDPVRFASLKPLKGTISFDLNATKTISPNLIGIFFEDINYAADGGLYAELIQNRDFEYVEGESRREPDWNPLKAWQVTDGILKIDTKNPIHQNNSHYLQWNGGTLINNGYDGISLKKGEKYDFSTFARVPAKSGGTLMVALRDSNGNIVAQKNISVKGDKWKKFQTVLTPSCDVKAGSLAMTFSGGSIDLDMVSLFPQNTFKGRKNGLRADLAQVLADLKPRFMRFPGGCVAHGNGIDNIYDWKGSIGPLEARKPMRNLWGYHQTRGLGYHEYFLFCEDLGAEPLPVLAAGVPCQNSSLPNHNSCDELSTYGQQGGIPMDQMDQYVQDVLDLIEYANGDPKTSEWARLRAQAGHPKPFNLKYIGIGNEDIITDIFEERFKMINDAVKAKYPNITVVGTVGPFFEGTDYEEGWRFASKENVDMVDEHYYVQPGWLINNQDYYDNYDRSKPHVYLGEYASHLPGKPNNIETALSIALYLTGVERNGDVVELTSYAPLLAKRGHTQWHPDLIYFDNDSITLSTDYWTQHMYGNNSGNEYISSLIQIADNKDKNVRNRIGASAVKDENGDVIIKLVNMLPVAADMKLDGIDQLLSRPCEATILSGDPADRTAIPTEFTPNLTPAYQLPPYSFTVLRFKQN